MADLTLTRGAIRVWVVTITDSGGSAVDLTGWSLYFTVRELYPKGNIVSDSDAVIAKSTASGISLTAPENGACEITVASADTRPLPITKPKTYLYELKAVAANDTEPQTMAAGYLQIVPDPTRAV